MELNINNKIIEYYKFGNGKKTLVMIPGLSLFSSLQGEIEVRTAYQMFTNDFEVYLINQGLQLKENTSITTLAQDYIEVFKTLKLKDIYLFGPSLGGMICQEIAHLEPNLIKKLILASTISGSIDNKQVIQKWKTLAQNNLLNDLSLNMLDDIYLPSTVTLIKDRVVKASLLVSQQELNRFIILINAILSFNSEEYLSKINIPTLVISAKGDKVFSYLEGEHLHLKIKNSQFILYDEKNGHAVYDEESTIKEKIYNFFN